MGLWYFALVHDPVFDKGLKDTELNELRNISAYMEGQRAMGFHVGDRCRAIRREIEKREEREGRQCHG